ncbi:unnamed protein product [Polarella glacialis]|uniref:E3 ubiquitin-protein ligase listerin n=1 Tax=Polarella glacialis TaxID=89957 RepID=A0A813F0L0_POLGL|nr:unnamed protein product [Polarella glacialis]
MRLRLHGWVPAKRSEVSGTAKELLSSAEALFREDSDDAGDLERLSAARLLASKGNAGATCSDVIFTVLETLSGPELTAELWSVGDALRRFVDWEADDSGEESGDNSDKDLGAQAEQGMLEGRTPATSSGPSVRAARRAARSAAQSGGQGMEDMPNSCTRRCAAALAAWELLLMGIAQGVQSEGTSSRHGGSSGEATPTAYSTESGDKGQAPPEPGELIAAVLQLTPDQIAGGKNFAFKAGVAPQMEQWTGPVQPLLRLLCHVLTSGRLAARDDGTSRGETASEVLVARALAEDSDSPDFCHAYGLSALAARTFLLALRVAPAAVRSFWEQLPRRRDRDLVEKLVARSFSPVLFLAEAAAASTQLEAHADRLTDIEASVTRRAPQLVLQLAREELRAELCVLLPPAFPLRLATAEPPEKMPGIPKPRIRNWMLQARQVLAGQKPMVVGRVMLMWARSFAVAFDGVEDCPICYNVVHLTTQTIPRKACPTCKHKFHNECLYHWFKTSAKTTCPLCTQPF